MCVIQTINLWLPKREQGQTNQYFKSKSEIITMLISFFKNNNNMYNLMSKALSYNIIIIVYYYSITAIHVRTLKFKF